MKWILWLYPATALYSFDRRSKNLKRSGYFGRRRDILIVEDIIDSGLTLSYLVELFKYRKAKSVKIVTLLDKPTGRKVDLKADYVGFIVPDEFVVGYGLDYKEQYRNLPYIGVLKPSVYSN